MFDNEHMDSIFGRGTLLHRDTPAGEEPPRHPAIVLLTLVAMTPIALSISTLHHRYRSGDLTPAALIDAGDTRDHGEESRLESLPMPPCTA